MAKADVPVTVVVYGDAFGDNLPRIKERLAKYSGQRELEALRDRVYADACAESALSCTDWQDEPTEPSGKHWSHRGPEWEARNDSLVERLSKVATEEIGTPYLVFVERDMASRMIEMTMHCQSCGHEQQGSIPEYKAEERSDWGDVLLQNLIDAWQEEDACDCLDGLTEERILQRYSYLQRGDLPICHEANQRVYPLTPAQRETASVLWSQALKRKQQEAREKERVAIVCDDDRWEP